MRTRTYVLTLSRTFPKGHPREGQETEFREAAENALTLPHRGYVPWKMHTIRANYGLWKRRIDEVNAGRAVLSVREWLGAPRRSKQRELLRLDRGSGIGVERLDSLTPVRTAPFDSNGECTIFLSVDGVEVDMETIAANEGLTFEDFEEWWKDFDRSRPLAIVHLTPHRYAAGGGKTEGEEP